MWIYQIAAHSLFRDEKFISNGLYSGYPPHTNNPEDIELVGLGPLPPGDYTILKAFDHLHLGPVAMPLEPARENIMYNRGSFYIHGDSTLKPGFASEGCIIAPHEIRDLISASTDRILRVLT